MSEAPAHRIVSTAQLYRTHSDRLRGLAAAITLDRSMAEEVVHDVFAALAGRIDEVRNPPAYLQRAVINRSVQLVHRRDLARRAPLHANRRQLPPEIDEMWTVVAELPARQRAVVVLRFWEDLSYEQIAHVMGMPLGTVRSTLHRALSRLKERLR